ncbi:MAG: transposase, partial [Planctomycetaceae bacterium]|nr:transposase [Planctomycetaceae bacterium]
MPSRSRWSLRGSANSARTAWLAGSAFDANARRGSRPQRVTWVDNMRPLLQGGVDVYQVVFTMPDELSSLALGNRREMFRLLFHSAWQSLKCVIENEQQFEPAAAMVLHTWNQHLESHVHVHAVVPAGGPSLTNPEE